MIKLKNESGLTLIELLIAMAISGVLLGAMLMTFHGQSTSYNSQQEVTSLQENMWAALQLMSRDIRMAGYDPLGTAKAGITLATDTSFEATADINEDGDLTDPGPPPGTDPNEDIKYWLDGTTLKRTVDGSDQPVMNNVTKLAFEYKTATSIGPSLPVTWEWKDFSGAAATTAEMATIKVVKVCLQARTTHPTSIKDTSSYEPTYYTPTPPTTYHWTPAAPGRYLYRTMCIEVKGRNLTIGVQ
jgi:type IV pilus assembly protein PilW